MKIVAWLSVLTEHQVHTFKCLETYLSEPIQYVLGSEELAERKSQGWSCVRLESLNISVLPKKEWFTFGKALQQKNVNAVHLFGGLWSDKRFLPLILSAQKTGVVTALMMEPYVDRCQSYFEAKPSRLDQCKAWIRPWAYKVAGKLMMNRFCAVFAISDKAVLQVKNMGAVDAKIFPFGYFIPRYEGCQPLEKKVAKPIRMVFIGSLIERKGLTTLLRALELLGSNSSHILLDIYGPGNPEQFEFRAQGVRYCGVVPFGDAQKVIALYDVLILPSFHDGWGVVINEALLQGVPALVSSECGAKALVESSGAGAIFLAKDPDGLAKFIKLIIDQPSVLESWRSAAIAYRETLSPSIAGAYLYECLQSATGSLAEKPVAPWYMTSGNRRVH